MVDNTFEFVLTRCDIDWTGDSKFADKFKLSKSTVCVYLGALHAEEFLTKEDGRYRLSLRFLELGGTSDSDSSFLGSSATRSVNSRIEPTKPQIWASERTDGGFYSTLWNRRKASSTTHRSVSSSRCTGPHSGKCCSHNCRIAGLMRSSNAIDYPRLPITLSLTLIVCSR